VTAHLQAALTYAARGWRVVPTWHLTPDGTCACRLGSACEHAGKHPRVKDWPRVASSEEDVVRGWWETWPDANVSIVCGRESGVFVVDVDPRHDGDASLQEYEENTEYGMPATLTAATGGGGRHLFYAWPEDGEPVPSLVDWLPGVDVRGTGGQVVAPPSPHESGRFYTWSRGWEEGPARPPGELVARIRAAYNGPGERESLPPGADILDGVPEGKRNVTLFRWACRLRRQLGDDRKAVEVLVREAGRKAGLGEEELGTLLDSAFRQDHDDWSATRWAAGGVGDGEGFGTRPLTDDGNALRLVDRWGEDLLWTASRGWCWWDGRRWERDETLRSQSLARETARAVSVEELAEAVEGVRDDVEPKALATWAQKSQSAGRVESMLRLARDHLARRDADLDAKPWLLCVRNGTVDLRSGRLQPHSREDLLTRVAPVAWDEDAECPRWEAFLRDVVPGVEERAFLKAAVGYSLTGVTDAKAMFILWGAGNNGKSVFVEAVRTILFGEYAKVAPKTLVMQGGQEHPTELAGLAGVRFVTLGEEVTKRDRLRSGLLKSLTGGDTVTARFMRQDFFDFEPELKLWVPTNHKPGLQDFGEAMTSRLRLVPFTQVIPEEARRDRGEVIAEFREEGSGMLRWALDGLAEWRRVGLRGTTAMQEEVESWVDDDDLIKQFLDEVCYDVGEDGAWTEGSDVYRAYEIWVTMRGEDKARVGMRTLSKELAGHGVKRVRPRGEDGRRATGWSLRLRTAGVNV